MNIASARNKEDPMGLKIQINFSHFKVRIFSLGISGIKSYKLFLITLNIASVRNKEDPMDLKIQINSPILKLTLKNL